MASGKLLAKGLSITFGLLGIIGGNPLPAQAQGIAYHRVVCPPSTVIEVCWREKIGSDPDLTHTGDGCAKYRMPFTRKARSGQKVMCFYEHPIKGKEDQAYSYKMKREILDVTKDEARAWEFKLKE